MCQFERDEAFVIDSGLGSRQNLFILGAVFYDEFNFAGRHAQFLIFRKELEGVVYAFLRKLNDYNICSSILI